MPDFLQEPPFVHGAPPRIGILLINLGTPDAPTAAALKPYLREFLSDRRVVEIPRSIWWPILNLIILRIRPRKSAAKYAAIWSTEGSPLLVHTQRQAKLLRGYLGDRLGDRIVVDFGMRYGRPRIADALDRLRAQGCDRILSIPLYPQYAASASGTANDAVMHALLRMRNQPALHTIRCFHDDPGYIGALAASVRDHWQTCGRGDVLVMSFHGVPRFTLDKGDPYHCHCQKTGRLLAEALGLAPERYRIAFQSRFGRAEWLKPYTVDVLSDLGRKGTSSVDVICPGFVADCLETLEEIAMEGKATFVSAGGGEYRYIAALNERHDWIAALAQRVEREISAWATDSAPTADLEQSGLRARAMGARA